MTITTEDVQPSESPGGMLAAGGAALGAVGAGALAIARKNRLNAAGHAVMDGAKRLSRSAITKGLRPGDILVNEAGSVLGEAMDGTTFGRKLRNLFMIGGQRFAAGKGRHASIYAGRGKVVHMYPGQGHHYQSIADTLEPGTVVVRPNVSTQERGAAAQRAREAVAAQKGKPSGYSYGAGAMAGLNKLMPLGGVCPPGEMCSSTIANMYNGAVAPNVKPGLTTPLDLLGGNVSVIGGVRKKRASIEPNVFKGFVSKLMETMEGPAEIDPNDPEVSFREELHDGARPAADVTVARSGKRP